MNIFMFKEEKLALLIVIQTLLGIHEKLKVVFWQEIHHENKLTNTVPAKEISCLCYSYLQEVKDYHV